MDPFRSEECCRPSRSTEGRRRKGCLSTKDAGAGNCAGACGIQAYENMKAYVGHGSIQEEIKTSDSGTDSSGEK